MIPCTGFPFSLPGLNLEEVSMSKEEAGRTRFQAKGQRCEKGQTPEDQQEVQSAEAPHTGMNAEEEKKEAHKGP